MGLTGKESFLRVAEVKVFDKFGQGLDFTGLRVKFRAEKTSESIANTAKISIFNLKKESRTFLEGEDMTLQLDVGYPSKTETIVFGNITKALSDQKHPDWITTIEVGDGQKNLKEKHIDVSWKEGTPYQAILQQAISSLGLTLGPNTFAVSEIAGGGFSFSGKAKDLIDVLAKRFGVEWSVQNGAVEASTDKTPLPGTAAVVSSTTGLIGNVKKTARKDNKGKSVVGIEFKNLINGDIAPGRAISVSSADVDGFFKVRKAVLDGDTHDGPWFVYAEAEALS